MHRDLDAALETAASRTREAQEELIEKEQEKLEIVPAAILVERRAEDLDDLASMAAEEASADQEASANGEDRST